MAPRKQKPAARSTIPGVYTKADVDPSEREYAPEPFPFARYTSLVGVHTSLLAFSALFLPQTTSFFIDIPARVTDRPAHPLVETLAYSPVLSLVWIAGGVFVLQSWWAGWIRMWYFEQASRGTYAEKKIEQSEISKAKFADYGKASVFTLTVSVVYHAIVILFGAPVLSHHPHTYLLSLILAFLTVFAPAYSLGRLTMGNDTASWIKWFNWTRLFVEFSPRNAIERAMVYPSIGTLVGCWFGVIPLALDWDRPWQAWPLPPLFGAIIGYILGSLGALVTTGVYWLAEEQIRSEQMRQKTK
ncbi:hypothetical protein CONPUDRAFT_144940 [Coniophora puteana RWD-64-598 SS2]|uniref:PIG-F-domain-containing protein n=1 Tax=Coniophora puteana (strain RWD-64-598) TaxID=741705 RepID=A0A5M3MM77_CONPW|nr:uncharacterized protein CONPUDRAFT_144940 [Coniophora puteana RWD-64-598 SS2]EIW79785.1 hypothetical protein CONPUDRAFT_144940 [Coniophora puteana RWD-64-598 SS2]